MRNAGPNDRNWDWRSSCYDGASASSQRLAKRIPCSPDPVPADALRLPTTRTLTLMTSPADPTKDVLQYDAFLSHNSREQEAVERIAFRLKEEKLKPWLDKWELTPGRSSIQGIEDGLKQSRACVIFYGPAGIGPWHELERHAALVKSVNSRGEFPVIPVLLPGVTKPLAATLPPLLQDVTWVSFQSCDPLDETALQLLLCGIRGEKPREFFLRQRAATQPHEPPNVPQEVIVPHGLRSFTERDSRFFLRLLPGARDGRGLPESLAFWKDKLEEVDPERTFAVGLLHGPSGCGKSSLVKAGLLPRLAESVRPIYLEATPSSNCWRSCESSCPSCLAMIWSLPSKRFVSGWSQSAAARWS